MFWRNQNDTPLIGVERVFEEACSAEPPIRLPFGTEYASNSGINSVLGKIMRLQNSFNLLMYWSGRQDLNLQPLVPQNSKS